MQGFRKNLLLAYSVGDAWQDAIFIELKEKSFPDESSPFQMQTFQDMPYQGNILWSRTLYSEPDWNEENAQYVLPRVTYAINQDIIKWAEEAKTTEGGDFIDHYDNLVDANSYTLAGYREIEIPVSYSVWKKVNDYKDEYNLDGSENPEGDGISWRWEQITLAGKELKTIRKELKGEEIDVEGDDEVVIVKEIEKGEVETVGSGAGSGGSVFDGGFIDHEGPYGSGGSTEWWWDSIDEIESGSGSTGSGEKIITLIFKVIDPHLGQLDLKANEERKKMGLPEYGLQPEYTLTTKADGITLTRDENNERIKTTLDGSYNTEKTYTIVTQDVSEDSEGNIVKEDKIIRLIKEDSHELDSDWESEF